MNRYSYSGGIKGLGFEFRRTFTFDDCSPSYNKRGVYIIEFENGIKVGQSKNLADRIKSYHSPWCRPVVRVSTYKTMSPHIVEQFMIKYLLLGDTVGKSREFSSEVDFDRANAFMRKSKWYLPNFLTTQRKRRPQRKVA